MAVKKRACMTVRKVQMWEGLAFTHLVTTVEQLEAVAVHVIEIVTNYRG
jgi:hypothetical protein